MSNETPRKNAALFLRLTPQLKADIEALAKSADRPLAYYVRKILQQHAEATKKRRNTQ